MAIHREHIEWCDLWIRNADRCGSPRPRVLFIGDSITRSYYQHAAEAALMPHADPARFCTSRSLSDPVFFLELALMLGQFNADVIHVNNGLHGGEHDEYEYRDGLRRLVASLRRDAQMAKIVWAQTTPLRREGQLDQPSERQPWVEQRNCVAAAVMAQAGIPLNDLHATVLGRADLYAGDGVHFNEAGCAVLAAQAVAAVRREL